MRIGIIGGTGLGEALRKELPSSDFKAHDINTPFGKTSAPLLTGKIAGTEVALLQRHGEGHVFNPAAVPYRANIFALKTLGVTHILAGGAVGSLREDIHPGELVICDQLIDLTRNRRNTFYENAAVHVEFAEPFCPVMRGWLRDAGAEINNMVHGEGTYVCMEGPAFSTRAESRMHRQLGGDLIGMTACPEAKLAREAEIAYAMVALVTDYDCWREKHTTGNNQELLSEIIANMHHATRSAINLFKQALQNINVLQMTPSPAANALQLALWTDRNAVPDEEKQRLQPLWGRYFEN